MMTRFSFFLVVASILASLSASPFVAGSFYNFSMTWATPSTSTGGSFKGLVSCDKDSTETNAYCGSNSGYIVKLTLDPIAYSAQLGTSTSYAFSVVLYEGGDSPRLFYIDDSDTIKFLNASTFSSPTTVGSTGTAYGVNTYGRMVVDSTNNMIYVSNFYYYTYGKVYKIINIDSATPIVDSSAVVSLSTNTASDLILANGDVYVTYLCDEFNSNTLVTRVPNVASPSASPSKTVTASIINYSERMLFVAYGFLYVLTYQLGKVVKLSIGSSDADFSVVATSEGAADSTIGSYSFLLTPDSHHLLVLCTEVRNVYFFDVDAFEYKSSMEVSNLRGGVLTSSGKLAFCNKDGTTLYQFNFEIPTTTTSTTTTSTTTSTTTTTTTTSTTTTTEEPTTTTTTTTTPPPTTSTTTTDSSSSSSPSSSSLSSSGKLGIGLGIGIGVPVIIAFLV